MCADSIWRSTKYARKTNFSLLIGEFLRKPQQSEEKLYVCVRGVVLCTYTSEGFVQFPLFRDECVQILVCTLTCAHLDRGTFVLHVVSISVRVNSYKKCNFVFPFFYPFYHGRATRKKQTTKPTPHDHVTGHMRKQEFVRTRGQSQSNNNDHLFTVQTVFCHFISFSKTFYEVVQSSFLGKSAHGRV